jgi:hypothetical protein
MDATPQKELTVGGCPDPGFSSAANYGVGGTPWSVAVGDFNLDSNPDLAVVARGTSVAVLLGTGTGTFGAATNYPVGSAPYGVAVGDFNLDSKPDLAVVNGSSDNLSILLGTGTGAFGAATNYPAGDWPYSVAVGDFNLDGKPDLAVASHDTDMVMVYIGTGTGTFGTPANYAVGDVPQSVAVADFNLDTYPDLAVANNYDDNVSILLGTGTGTFGAATNFGVGIDTHHIAVGDFNLDGSPDFVTADTFNNGISVRLGTGTGSFGPLNTYLMGTDPYHVAVSDYNLDGYPDIAATNAGGTTNIAVRLGTGTGTFGEITFFPVGQISHGLVVGDFNLDGSPDLAATLFQAGSVAVLLNTCGGAPPPPTSTPIPTIAPTPTPCTAGQFSDVPVGHTFYPYVSCLVDRGVMSGYSDCTFRPTLNLTRGQLSKIVSNAANFAEPHSTQSFEDVATDHAFYLWIERLASRGIIGGYACGGEGEPCVPPGNRPYFRSGANVTRGQTSKIVAIAASLPAPRPGQQTFEDVPTTHTFWSWIESLSTAGATGGYPCGGEGEPCVPPGNRPYFRPGNNVTRGQSSKIVANTFFPGCTSR